MTDCRPAELISQISTRCEKEKKSQIEVHNHMFYTHALPRECRLIKRDVIFEALSEVNGAHLQLLNDTLLHTLVTRSHLGAASLPCSRAPPWHLCCSFSPLGHCVLR